MNIRKIKILIIFSILTPLILSAAIYGCSAQKEDLNQSDDINNTSSMSANKTVPNKNTETPENAVTIPHFTHAFSPLTYQKFTAIRNNNEEFSKVYIYYHTDTNYLPQGAALDLRHFMLDAGKRGISRYFNTIESYKGDYRHYLDYLEPPERVRHTADFTPAQLELIYNYLDADQSRIDYFFSNEEFMGLDDPHDSQLGDVLDRYFGFTLAFYKPDSDYYIWAISKCVDDYPEQGTPLHGLFEIIEDNFMSQFE